MRTVQHCCVSFCLLSCILFLGRSTQIRAQSVIPKREFRGVWVATVKNIDWPSRSNLSGTAQQEELIDLLDRFKALGMNAIIFQVRPGSDAFYYSEKEPWSEWLTGTQGKAPDPFYDPLSFAIEACHDRGMELHAWVNPFRAYLDVNKKRITSLKHVTLQHPDWVVTYGSNAYIDPGIPEARTYVLDVLTDIVKRYDIDALHIDDYFYPYPIAGTAFPDTTSFQQYGRRYSSKADWRRNNVDRFIVSLREQMNKLKPQVKLGISPFGIWRNQDKDPEGSATRAGATSYDDLYADIRKWLANGWIDYVAPQLYFSIGYPPAAYDILLDWWIDNSYDRHLYIGKAAYKINNNPDKNWENAQQIPNQIRLDRTSDKVDGSIYFSARSFKPNPLGIADSLLTDLYNSRALPPNVNWMTGATYDIPQNLEVSAQYKGVVLTWDPTESDYVAIYRFDKKEPIDINATQNMIDMVRADKRYYVDDRISKKGKYYYVATGLDRLYNESLPTLPIKVKVKKKMLKRQ